MYPVWQIGQDKVASNGSTTHKLLLYRPTEWWMDMNIDMDTDMDVCTKTTKTEVDMSRCEYTKSALIILCRCGYQYGCDMARCKFSIVGETHIYMYIYEAVKWLVFRQAPKMHYVTS